jgi:branched-chain amino acid transport system permease protein
MMSAYVASVLTILSINVIVAYAVFLPAAAGIMNLGVAGFVAIGAYTSAWLNNNGMFPVGVQILIAGLAAALVACVVSFPILRMRGVYIVLATFGLSEIVGGLIINLDAVGGASGYPVATYLGLPVTATVAGLTMVVCAYLMSTRFGLMTRAVHDDERAAEQLGINIRRTQVIAFSVGAFFAGMAGALYGFQYNYIEIQNFNAVLSISALLFVLLGGTQTSLGPLAGAIVYTLLPEFLRGSTQWRFVIFALFIIVVMAVRPEGLVTRALVDWRSQR